MGQRSLGAQMAWGDPTFRGQIRGPKKYRHVVPKNKTTPTGPTPLGLVPPPGHCPKKYLVWAAITWQASGSDEAECDQEHASRRPAAGAGGFGQGGGDPTPDPINPGGFVNGGGGNVLEREWKLAAALQKPSSTGWNRGPPCKLWQFTSKEVSVASIPGLVQT